jgi:succinate dehydrogenase / fumarate reductase iron-sulfur subunit
MTRDGSDASRPMKDVTPPDAPRGSDLPADTSGLVATQRAMTPTGTTTAIRPETPERPATQVRLRVFRGEAVGPTRFDDFDVPVEEGMVVLDALHWIQGNAAPDLAVRWNCKAAKCGSCSAEVNGRPRLTCKTRLSDFDPDEEITVEPMRTFPLIRDLVTDVSWNYEVNKSLQPFTPPDGVAQTDWRWQQEDIERVQEYRKCIECFLCQDVCHVLRNHETDKPFMGPRFLVRAAGLEMHPIDQADRRGYLKDTGNIGYCNITKCCTEVCPEHIKITDNAIIPLKERVADEFYDPLQWAWRKLRGRSTDEPMRASLPVLQGGSAAAHPEGESKGESASAEPMAAPEPPLPTPPARKKPRTKASTRRSDAGDETPSEG